jgi:hypothetical protein
MPRHQTSRCVETFFFKYAKPLKRFQEYFSAFLAAIEAMLIIVATCFLYSSQVSNHINYSSYCFISGQCLSLIPNTIDFFELLYFLKKQPRKICLFSVISHLLVTLFYIAGTILIIIGSILTLNHISIFAPAPWVFFSGR